MDNDVTVETVHRLLRQREATVAVAESLTGGRIQSLMTELSGASDVFEGGVTAYTIDQKVAHLGVDRANAVDSHAVSEQVAREMAKGVCEMFGSRCGIGTTGYADVTESVPQAFAWVAVTVDGTVRCERVPGRGLRRDVQQQIAERALELLRDLLLTLEKDENG